jgi:hypothetical protein
VSIPIADAGGHVQQDLSIDGQCLANCNQPSREDFGEFAFHNALVPVLGFPMRLLTFRDTVASNSTPTALLEFLAFLRTLDCKTERGRERENQLASQPPTPSPAAPLCSRVQLRVKPFLRQDTYVRTYVRTCALSSVSHIVLHGIAFR